MKKEKELDLNQTAEEKELDLDQVEEDALEAERAEEEARESESSGAYRHTFSKPFQWKGEEYRELTFEWSALTGQDHLEIEHELLRRGRTLVSPAFTGDFLAGMAARACTERDEKGKRVLDSEAMRKMSMTDFGTITRRARDFLLAAPS